MSSSVCLERGGEQRREKTYAHAEGTAEIVEDNPRAGVASVIHVDWL